MKKTAQEPKVTDMPNAARICIGSIRRHSRQRCDMRNGANGG